MCTLNVAGQDSVLHFSCVRSLRSLVDYGQWVSFVVSSMHFSFAEGDFHGVDVLFNEATGLRVVWTGSSVMFEAVFICKGVPLLGGKGLSIVCEDLQRGSFESKLLCQAAYNSSHRGPGHLE